MIVLYDGGSMKHHYGIIALAGVIVLWFAAGEEESFLQPCVLEASDSPVSVTEVRARTADGEAVVLGGGRERAVLLNFWASWCAPCVHELPALVQLMTRLEGLPVDFFAISQDDEEQSAFLQARDLEDLPVIYDDYFRLARHFSVSRLPVTLLMRDGRIVWRYDGACDWDDDDVAATIVRQIQSS